MGRPMQLVKPSSGVGHRDPDLEEAINSVPPIPVSKEQLAKNGWTSCQGHNLSLLDASPKHIALLRQGIQGATFVLHGSSRMGPGQR